MSHSNTPPVRNRAPLTARSSSLRYVSAAEHQTAEQYSKTGRTKPRKHSQEAIYHGTLTRTSSRYQVFEKLLWKPSEDASQRSSLNQMSLRKITRSSDSYSTVPPIVNGGDWGCIVHDLETIIVLVLLAFNFIPQRSHHSQTLPRPQIRDSATATLKPSKWSHQHNRSAYFPLTVYNKLTVYN